MNKFIKFLDNSIFKFWIIFCSLLFCIGLFIKAMYNMDDSPYFVQNGIWDIVALLFVSACYLLIFYFAKKIEKIPYIVLWIVFGAVACAFVILVPLKAFSDMKYVKDGALMISNLDFLGIKKSEYLQYIAKNLKVSLVYGILDFFLPKSEIALKIINVFFYLISVHFVSKIAVNFKFPYPKTLFIAIASFIPLILYCNHIYFDYPTFCFSLVAIYFYTKARTPKNMFLSAVFIGLAYSLRVLAGIFIVAVVVDYIFHYWKKLFENKCKKLGVLILYVMIIVFVTKGIDSFVNANFRTPNAQDEPIWTMFWMGINEEEFGMMHNEIYEGPEQFSDFYNLLISRTPKEDVCLFSKKIYWTWTQGTYQSQRYGFGLDTLKESNKFEYHTCLTSHLLLDNQILRRWINRIARAQYMMWFLFMILGMCLTKKEGYYKYRIFTYSMFGTFLILIFYEMKSRYVFHCIICMAVLACVFLEHIAEKNKQNSISSENV